MKQTLQYWLPVSLAFGLVMLAMAYTLCWEGMMPDEQTVQPVQPSMTDEPDSMDDVLWRLSQDI